MASKDTNGPKHPGSNSDGKPTTTTKTDQEKLANGIQKVGQGAVAQNAGNIGDDVGLLNELHWRDRHVCRIELQSVTNTSPNGTGFLVAEDLVLTNWHVVEDHVDEPGRISCRFDCRSVGPNQYKIGPPIAVKEILTHRRCSKDEKAGRYTDNSTVHPSYEELDYALLWLEKPVGRGWYQEDSGSKVQRRWIVFPENKISVTNEDEIYILQHPLGGVIRSTHGSAVVVEGLYTRQRYLTPTLAGSSGSPCFVWNKGARSFSLVALHNYGDPNWVDGVWKESKFNHGVPIHLIERDLKSQDYWPLRAIKWRWRKSWLWGLQTAWWRAADFLEQKLFPTRKHLAALAIATFATASAIGSYIWWSDPPLKISGPTYAWFTPSRPAADITPLHMTLNFKFQPHKNTIFVVDNISARLIVGDTPFEFRPVHFTNMNYECFERRNCKQEPYETFKVTEQSEAEREIKFYPQETGIASITWKDFTKALYDEERIQIEYFVEHQSTEDSAQGRLGRLAVRKCEVDPAQIKLISSITRFAWPERLPPAFSPTRITCVEPEAKG